MRARLIVCLALLPLSLLAEEESVFVLEKVERPVETYVATEHQGEPIALPSTIGAAFSTAGRLRFPLTGALRIVYAEKATRVMVEFEDRPGARRMVGRLPPRFEILTLPERTEMTALLPAGTERNAALYAGFREAVEDAGYSFAGPLSEWIPPGSRRGGPFLLAVTVEAASKQ